MVNPVSKPLVLLVVSILAVAPGAGHGDPAPVPDVPVSGGAGSEEAKGLPAEKPADLVLLGGKIVSMDEANPLAQALAVRAGRVVAVGRDTEVARWIGDRTRVIRLEGKLVLPGFIESHGHFVALGRSKMTLDLSKATSWDEIVRLVQQAAREAPPGRWIIGQGWHQAKWQRPPQPNVQGYPTHDKLSQAVPDHPVLLTHGTGHMCLANAKAMELAGVDRDTPDPEGGEILHDPAGEPTGVFREQSMDLITDAWEETESSPANSETAEELDKAIRLATDECLSKGVTTFCDASSSFATIDHFRQLAERGGLRVRLWVMIDEPNDALARRLPEYRLIGLGDDHLTVRAIKRFADGALGTQGAWLLKPYNDLPESTGLNTTPVDSIRRTAELAIEHHFQLCVHAIGDRANREILNVFEAVFKEHPDERDLRWRIEHAQHLDPADIPRFGQLGVIASMQGVHCTSDGPFVVKRLGVDRAREGAYAWRRLLDSGAVIANGTDTPVEDVSPIACFCASVTRKLADGTLFFPEQRMTRREALRSYTLDAAYAAFEENLKGSLTPGKLADVVVLSRDILTVPEEEIPGTRVLWTIVGGNIVYEGTAP
jgi:predicted amidohydrolase YtcJ